MKVVVVGAFGHIGTYLVPQLIAEGHDVVAISRGLSKPYEENPLWDKAVKVRLDRGKEPDFARRIADMRPDAVIDLINFDLRDTKAMVAALRDTGCRHYLYCSSCWAHGRAGVVPIGSASPVDSVVAVPSAAIRPACSGGAFDGMPGDMLGAASGDLPDEPLCAYGKDKLASERYLRHEFESDGFPATCIRPGQISGPGWAIIGPWGNTSLVPFQLIARGEEIALPHFGMETIHHVHGYDVAQCFCKAVMHRERALGQVFEAASGNSITLYGYAQLLGQIFGTKPQIRFLPWKEWCEYEGNEDECESTYLHIARSGSYGIDRERELLGYDPKYTNVETIRLAVQSYVERGLL